jgi:DNA-binding CsgD family transcriptional regulator/PAS domain-containing protein
LAKLAGVDGLLDTIEAIHAAGLDAELWLRALTNSMGGIAATLERFDRRTLEMKEFLSFGIPPAHELVYLTDLFACNPRLPFVRAQEPGKPLYDYMVLDERAMNRDPFYSQFLAPVGYRYFMGANLRPTAQEHALVSIQFGSRQGHVDQSQIDRFQRVLPHVEQAIDVARRLRGADGMRRSLEHGLDWLADGVMLLRADGTVLHANTAMQAIARADDGVRLRRGHVEFASTEVQQRFAKALGTQQWLRDKTSQLAITDFPAPRPSGNPSYLVSIRPLPARRHDSAMESAADIIVFVRDPLTDTTAALQVLRDAFGLTEAEAKLARAVQSGVSMSDYARVHAVSIATVYTHMRSIKEKTGCSRQAELIRKLNGLQVPLMRSL